MSGHSKWANIKHKKEKTDGERAKIFTKLGREIAVCVKNGGPDPASNFKLKDIVYKAKSNNMPNDNIERCIKKAAGEAGNDDYMEMTYEGYGPKGAAVIVETLSNNKNRTAGDIKHYFDKFGGNLGAIGCVSWMFDKKGDIIVEKDESVDEETLMMDALDAGAEDFEAGDECYEIVTAPEDFTLIVDALESKGYTLATAEVTMIPQNYIKLTDERDMKMMSKLLESLEDNDDIQNVYHNWENADEYSE
ncbi:MAG: YebC/PmpR family DNA-binding transcriptional regulator [Bacillota bacterium]|nr:YebC/PmpR family DNA-binding transcriptional regulator [Bacillota bacterium]